MSEKYKDLTIIDPEQHFRHVLINRWDEIGGYLYNPRISQCVTVRKAMLAFISRLPNNEKETTLKDVYDSLNSDIVSDRKKHEKLAAFYRYKQKKTPKFYKDYIEVYGEISKYLGETYFKDYRVAKPTHKKGTIGMPKQ